MVGWERDGCKHGILKGFSLCAYQFQKRVILQNVINQRFKMGPQVWDIFTSLWESIGPAMANSSIVTMLKNSLDVRLVALN